MPDAPDAQATLRVRMGPADVRYSGGLVDGAALTCLFGDLATELSIRHDGDEGLFRAYEEIEFLAPVRLGDYIEARATIVSVGSTSRRMSFEAWKQIEAIPEHGPTAAQVLGEPVLVARAVGTVVVPEERQRLGYVESAFRTTPSSTIKSRGSSPEGSNPKRR